MRLTYQHPFKKAAAFSPNKRGVLPALLIIALLASSCLPTPAVSPVPTGPSPTATPTRLPATPSPAPGAGLFMPGLTTEPLAVLFTQPAPNASDVPVDKEQTNLIIQFNHPVVPLTGVEAQAALPQPFTVQPPIPGRGEWLNTATYVFTPTQDLLVSTVYTVTVPPMKDMLGLELPGYSWFFTTTAPAVIKTYPGDTAQNCGVRQPITVTFNAEMDRPRTEAAFSLIRTDTGTAIAGKMEWQGKVLRFLPGKPLDYDAPYQIRLKAGAPAATGRAVTARDYIASFRTVKRPGVLSTIPANGETNAMREDRVLRITFASPMDPEGVKVTIVPTITYQQLHWQYDSNNTVAYIHGGWKPSQAYTVTIARDSRTRDGDTLGKDVIIRFTTAPLAPQVFLNTPGLFGMYDAYGPQAIYATATNIDRVDFRLFKVDRADFLRLIGKTGYRLMQTYRPPDANLLRAWSVSVQAPLNVATLISTTLTLPDGKPLPVGTYYIQAASPKAARTSDHVFIVSRLNLALKHTNKEVLVWVTDLASGKPVSDQPLTVLDENGDVLASGLSDAEGLFRATANITDPWGEIYVLSEAAGRILAATGSGWQAGISPWEFGLSATRYPQDYYGNLYTDRAIYRPGQSVFFKGILRRDDDGAYTLPERQPVTIKARDPQGRQVFSQTVTLNEFGSFNGEIRLSDAAPTGGYSLSAEIGSGSKRFYLWGSFQVAEYRRPEFQVTIQTDKPEYIAGQTIRIDAAAAYFFGGPVADAALTWRLFAEDYFFRPENVKGYWDFADYDVVRERRRVAGEVIREGKGKTDGNGRFHLELPADLSEFPLSQVFTLEAEVTDINNQVVANRTTMVVHKGAIYVGLRPQRYVGMAGKEQAVDVLTVDTKGVPTGSIALSLSFYERQWYSVREKQEDGRLYWKSAYTDTLISTVDLITDAQGRGVARFTPPRAGIYRIVAQGKDGLGNTVRSATYLWVSGAQFVNWRMEDHDRIELIADKKQYMPGDIAEILIPAPFAGAEALLTVERGSIRQVRRLTLPTNSERVQLPIASDFAPNVYVSVMLVKGRGPDSPQPQFKLGYVSLPVATVEKELNITITPDRAQYQPRDKVVFTIQASDHWGKPVRAEFSLALVDKAIQSLAEERAPSLLQAFYGERPLAVNTAASLARSVERVSRAVAPEAKGGGGGFLERTIRKEFKDTAYWNPSVFTDANGRAQVTVTLPDNLTTWNLAAKGVTLDTLVGEARVDIVSTKDLLVRPVLPRFFTFGDRARLEAVVHNNTARDVTVEVSLEAQGLTISGSARQSVMVGAGGRAKAAWEVLASGEAQATVRFSASGDGLADAVEQTVPVKRPSAAETVGTAGQVETRIVEKIVIPAAADAMAGGLRIALSPSLAATTIDSLRFLEAFDYECSEQTISKFFPNVVTYLALKRLGIERPDLRQGLEVNVPRQVQRLYALQNKDGGWGWWGGEESRPVLTAYALLALHTAKEGGFGVDQTVLERAQQYLLNSLNKPIDAKARFDYNERAFVIYVLTAVGQNMTSRAVRLYNERANLDLFGKAFLLLVLHDLGQTQAQTLIGELASAALLTAAGAHWEEKERDHWNMNTNTRTTALAILALARSDPKNGLLPNAVRWLMAARKGKHWETTQETAWSVLALTEYMLATGELAGNYAYDVTVNGKPIADGRVSRDNIDQTREIFVTIQDLAREAAELAITRSPGDGRLYYTAYLQYYLPADKIMPLNRGILVARQYFAVDSQTLKPTSRQIESASIGDYVQVKLTLVAPTDLHYLVLEDPLPAGFEAVDASLKTASAAAGAPQLQLKGALAPGGGFYWKPYWWYWNHSEIRDDRVVLFATQLPRGVYEYTYLMRAGLGGHFMALPALAWEMYFPEKFGRSGGMTISVQP